MTLHLSENGTDDNLGCYVLGIPDRTGNVHQTLLNGNQELLDVTKRLSYLLTKKYQVVTYVSISGNFTDESIRDVVLEVDKLLSDGRGTQNPLSSTVNET
ncbi:hypothetical protein LJB42_003932 [Komagataella kurtzmanii]|nr:hypothetical protein LJB42_003932 [Komagataella kurtzmanii]